MANKGRAECRQSREEHCRAGHGAAPEVIVCQLQRTPGWETHLFRSIIEWPQRMDLWQQRETVLHCHDDPNRDARARLFYEANREAMDA
jgi:hypothetical protein